MTITRGAGPFNRPTNIAVGPRGDLYVSDGYGNCRVHQFSPAASQGSKRRVEASGGFIYHTVLPWRRMGASSSVTERVTVSRSLARMVNT